MRFRLRVLCVVCTACVPQGVNTSLYDPSLYTPLPLRDKVQLVFGKHWEVKLGQQATAALAATQPPPHTGAAAAVPAAAGQGGGSNGTAQQAAGGAGTGRGLRAALTTAATASPTTTPAQEGAASGSSGGSSKGSKSGGSKGARRPFRFISSFKWEARKVSQVVGSCHGSCTCLFGGWCLGPVCLQLEAMTAAQTSRLPVLTLGSLSNPTPLPHTHTPVLILCVQHRAGMCC